MNRDTPNDIPNVEFDPFPERRKDTDSLDKRADISGVTHIISQVVQFLMTKAIHESRKQDKYNQTLLGNVSFYLDYNDITKSTNLLFDKHPNAWRVGDIVSEIGNMEADIMMDKQATEDSYDNPFTY